MINFLLLKSILKFEKHFICKIFLCNINSYPEEHIPESLIDIEDLTDNDFLVACFEDNPNYKYIIHTWRGASVNIDHISEKEYVETIKRNFFSGNSLDEVVLIEESPFNESDDFINLL